MERIMNTSLKNLLAVAAAAAAVALPGVAFAQSSDAAYCGALVSKYEHYLDMSSKRGEQPQSLEAKTGIEKCQAGDASGIPAIEKALRDAKYSLPSRSLTPVAATTNAGNCGVETWSTDKMMYVGTPCTAGPAYENSTGASH
jgi:hypothetical protein